MIAYVEGNILGKEKNTLIVGVHGVGYRVFVTPATVLTAEPGALVALHTHQYVREDSLELYGFERPEERSMFERLIAVTGIGPKSALGILSVSTPEQLRSAVGGGDIRLLTKVSGIGKKTAERLLVELRDTFAAEAKARGEAVSVSGDDVEIIEALERLGYRPADARRALEDVPETLVAAEARLKAALQQLAGKG